MRLPSDYVWRMERCDSREFEYSHPRTRLGPNEKEELCRYSDSQQRRFRTAARLLTKRLVLDECLPERRVAVAELEILSRDGLGRSTRPRVFWRGQLQPWSVSISHSGDSVLVAASRVPGVAVGVDLVPRELGDETFADTWLTEIERRDVPSSTISRHNAILWGIKEAIYKAKNRGEPFVPREIEVIREGQRWTAGGAGIGTWWQQQIDVREYAGEFAIIATCRRSNREGSR